MQLREHQKKAIQKDLPTAVTLIVVILLIFGLYLVQAPNSASSTALSFIIFFILTCLYICSSNAGLAKIVRAEIQRRSNTIWILPLILLLLILIYTFATNSANMFTAVTPLFCLVPIFLLQRIRAQGANPHWLDIPIVFLLWTPMVLALMSTLGLPPIQRFIDLTYLTGIVLLVYIYVVLREIPFSLRLRLADIRPAVYGFMLFVLLALVLTFTVGTMDMPHHSPAGALMATRVIIFAFFIALPEEILYRGVILQFLSQSYRGKYMPLLLSALIFAAAHIPASRFFDAMIYSGSPFSDQTAWLRFILTLLSGLFYGWIYLKTKKVAASAFMHFLVIWSWAMLLNG